MRPTPEQRDEVNRIIMDELVCGVFKAEAVPYFQRVYARMKAPAAPWRLAAPRPR